MLYKKRALDRLKVIAVTHKTVDLHEIGKFHVSDEEVKEHLHHLKNQMKLDELMYLSTCNRVEFVFVTDEELNSDFSVRFLKTFKKEFSVVEDEILQNQVQLFDGAEAVRHIYNVASSIDSVVVGEREIITQVRNAYENSKKMELTGDLIRILMRTTIETAKKVYTETQIATRPVSVVSLAYKKLKELHVKLDARFLIIGAGQTNNLMAKFLKKHGFKNFTIFNRSLPNAELLAKELSGKAEKLSELQNYKNGFDVILTCTAAAEHIISVDLYKSLLNGETDKKIIIDLSVPTDTDPLILQQNKVHFIDVAAIQAIANENMQERKKELNAVTKIIDEALQTFTTMQKVRKAELAMSFVPQQVKQIKETAVNEVFAKDIEKLDENSKAVLEKVLAYMEKKYISVPMKMAKEIILENEK